MGQGNRERFLAGHLAAHSPRLELCSLLTKIPGRTWGVWEPPKGSTEASPSPRSGDRETSARCLERSGRGSQEVSKYLRADSKCPLPLPEGRPPLNPSSPWWAGPVTAQRQVALPTEAGQPQAASVVTAPAAS